MEGSLKETPYEKRIQRLMTGEDGDQYGFYINITDNIVREVKNPEKACWEDETGRPGGVTYWLQKQIYPYILDNEEENYCVFSRRGRGTYNLDIVFEKENTLPVIPLI